MEVATPRGIPKPLRALTRDHGAPLRSQKDSYNRSKRTLDTIFPFALHFAMSLHDQESLEAPSSGAMSQSSQSLPNDSLLLQVPSALKSGPVRSLKGLSKSVMGRFNQKVNFKESENENNDLPPLSGDEEDPRCVLIQLQRSKYTLPLL